MKRAASRLPDLAITFLLILPGLANADKLTQSDVSYNDGRYQLTTRLFISASAASIAAIILDFDALDRIDPRVTESRLIGTNKEDRHLVYSAVRDCVLFFCFTIERVEEITIVSEFQITARAVPELSEVPYSVSRWFLEPGDNGTWLTYEIEIDPGIKAPRRIVKKRFARAVKEALSNIERLAIENAG